MLEIKNLIKTYPNGVKAINNISFKVNEGEFLVIIGLSGSGKSTLLKTINRLEAPTSGEIYFEKNDTTHLTGKALRKMRAQMGMIFQHFNLTPRYSVLENVLMGNLSRTSILKSILGIHTPEVIGLAMRYIDIVGLAGREKHRADTLSGGQQQRVAIARALMQAPKILLADEPVASLDPATSHSVMEYLKKVNVELGVTIVCNLHFLSLVRQYAHRVIALKSGKIIYDGKPDGIDAEWFKTIYGEEAVDVTVD